MKYNPTLPSLALAAAMLSAASAYALASPPALQIAQADPEDDGGEPRKRDRKGGAERPKAKTEDKAKRPEARQKSDDTGAREKRQRGDSPRDGERRQDTKRPQDAERPQGKERPARSERPGREKSAPPPKRDAAPPAAAPADRKPAPAKREPAPAPKVDDKTRESAPRERPTQPQGKPAPQPDQTPPAKKAAPPAPTKRAPETAPQPKTEQPAAKPSPKPRLPDLQAPKAAPDGAARPRRERGERRGDGRTPKAAPSKVKDLKELKQERKERAEDGGKRVVIEEPDNRVIVREGGRSIIRADETERFRRLGGDVRREKRNGLDISITVRPGGIEIFTETDERGRTLRRYRRDREGREVILFDNRDYYRRHRGGSFADAIIELPPPRLAIPRGAYIVDYEYASEEDIYDALSAPPVERLDRTYSLEEVRRSPSLRARMRRIDLDVINFDFGAWSVAPSQYPALERIADAMSRVIDRNPDEMFLVEGHTDAVGSDEDNLSLSDRRAETVAIILTDEFGVPPENITTQGYGEHYLKIDTQEAERQNRRVAVRRITPLISRGD